MQVTVEDVSAVSKKIKVVLPAEVVGKKLDAAFDALQGDVSIKGFRKGKVPRRILEKSFGDRVQHEVAEKLIQDTYFDALEESKLEAVVHPQVSMHEYGDDGSFSYIAEIDVKPEFELGEYKGMEIELEDTPVDEASVDSALEELRRQMAPLRSVTDRKVQDGDIVVLDFQGYHEGEPMKQVAGENYSVDIGSGRNGKEFEENLLGLAAGEETTREISFPAGFSNPVLAGKDVSFKLTVKDIKERVLPELDDEFAKDVDQKFETLSSLRDHIREQQQRKMEDARKGELSDKIIAFGVRLPYFVHNVLARRILTEIDEAEDSAQGEQARPIGRLTVSAPTLFGRMHVGPLMGEFLVAHPEVTGELLLADRIVNLVDEGIDLALRIGSLARGEVQCALL